jgi:hypothetical protein
MSEKGSEADIEPCRVNVAEVPRTDIDKFEMAAAIRPLRNDADGRGRGAEEFFPGNVAADRRTATKTGPAWELERSNCHPDGRCVSV